ncbi:hypothetical protein DL98DRAFT_540516 [Cadophora sp. DSE1049]|nr:hypothetical protein DL98DRAFT_540516 [Cadophora sp. DSE1049]
MSKNQETPDRDESQTSSSTQEDSDATEIPANRGDSSYSFTLSQLANPRVEVNNSEEDDGDHDDDDEDDDEEDQDDEEEEINDRFTAHWTGPYHPDAMRYAYEHNISYDRSGGQRIFNLGGHTSNFVIIGRSGGTDMAKFRVANRAFDEETRQRHRHDTELNTGTSLVGDAWHLATRGEKLRTCARHRDFYGNDKRGCEEALGVHVTALENDGRDENGVVGVKERIQAGVELLKRPIGYDEQHLELVTELESLILPENEEVWNWQEGIKEQYEVRERQQAVADKMNAEMDQHIARWE